jgi:hypothetical protein
MSMTIEEISGILTRAGVKHQFDKDGDIAFSYETEKYVNPRGEKGLLMYASLPKEGQMFTLTAHHAFQVKGSPHLDIFLKLCTLIQMDGSSLQFEYVPQNGTVQPCIEVPLMDNKLTAQQLEYCIKAMLHTVEGNAALLQKALETGEIPPELKKLLDEAEGDDTEKL